MLIDSKRPFFLISAIIILFLFSIIIYQKYQKITGENAVTIFTGAGSVKINIEYADTLGKLNNGLMDRISMPKNSGMLFIFPDEKIREFWMKDTLIPLEIMFISTKGRINEVITMEPCAPNALTCTIYTSKEPARFAIEVNAGFTAKNRIIEGDILEISGF